jgi:hypothetical protein
VSDQSDGGGHAPVSRLLGRRFGDVMADGPDRGVGGGVARCSCGVGGRSVAWALSVATGRDRAPRRRAGPAADSGSPRRGGFCAHEGGSARGRKGWASAGLVSSRDSAA